MKRVAVLGSTGSVGENALRVIEAASDRFEIVGLAAGTKVERLLEQARAHQPLLASVATEEAADALAEGLQGSGTQALAGEAGLCRVASMAAADVVVIAVSGAAGLAPALAAIEAGKTLALANKECLVMAGGLIMARAKERGVKILPVDSEHAGVFQALAGSEVSQVSKIVLPASGGPFLDADAAKLASVTPAQACNHPTWSMGKKISVDSATLMNKALELIEAYWLFGVAAEQIEVIIHPQSIVHAMVEFKDGSVVAQISVPDMRHPIIHALAWPERVDAGLPRLDLAAAGSLTFRALDPERFPGPGLARRSLTLGGSAPAVFAAADEAAVEAFLAGRIPFNRIVPLVAEVLKSHQPGPVESIEQAMAADAWARAEVDQRTA